MSVTTPDQSGRPSRPRLISERALLLILAAIFIGVAGAVSPRWAIGLTLGLAALTLLDRVVGSDPD